MASMTSSPLRLRPLPKPTMARLVARAKRLGIPVEDYARQLIEDGLALQREAEAMTIAQIMAPVRKAAGAVDEAEIVRLVDAARNDYRGRKPARDKRR